MKKFFLAAVAAIFVAGAVSAQERGGWTIGPQIGIYTNTSADGAIFGFGAVSRYAITDHWRVQPAMTFLCKKDCSIDINAEMQYLFRVARFWSVYPQAGLSANDMGNWSCSIDLGAGTDFTITRKWDLSAGFRWMIQTRDGRKNPIVVQIGASYKF